MNLHVSKASNLFLILLSASAALVFIYLIWINSGGHKYSHFPPTEFETFELYDGLLDLPTFNYQISNGICQLNKNKELLGVFVITSYVGNDNLRAAHRNAISQSELLELGFLRVFLLAGIPPKERFITQNQVNDEGKRFGDLLQGDFVEAYRNLSYKHIMGLKWAAAECRHAKYILKADDDIVFDLYHFKEYLEKANQNIRAPLFLGGYLLNKTIPKRRRANKWYVTMEEYSGDMYPNYASGWLYITNPMTALYLVRTAESKKPFWIDDIWITGMLREQIAVPLVSLNQWYAEYSEYIECCLRDMQTSSYECEYKVGPNGGDSKMIGKFLFGVKRCHLGDCIQRPLGHSVKETCVSVARRQLPDHGYAHIKPVRL